MAKKIQDPAGIQTQDLMNTSQTLLPLSHLDPVNNIKLLPSLIPRLIPASLDMRVEANVQLLPKFISFPFWDWDRHVPRPPPFCSSV